ncbi:MAG TPA: hypothetical protein VLF40_00650 [Candidatus Saccharimonadales bacterium]|nr:hypothetical protein [Candidatus Saccharimonadales bacterium]
MTSLKLILGVLALCLNVIGYIPYIRDIWRGKVKPQRVTWAIWTILTTIAAVNQVKNGGGYSSLFFISTAVLVSITFLLSIRKGMGGASKLDMICLVLAIALFGYWATVHDTRISTLIAVIIDGIGAVPTIIKTYKHPETETYIQWMLAGVAGILTVLAVTRLDWALIIYPLYVVVANGAIVGTKYFRERK